MKKHGGAKFQVVLLTGELPQVQMVQNEFTLGKDAWTQGTGCSTCFAESSS